MVAWFIPRGLPAGHGLIKGIAADTLDEDAKPTSFRILPDPADPWDLDPQLSVELIDEDEPG